MRLLADENFPRPLVEDLRANGHDVRWARTDYAGWSDIRILDRAESESRIVLTLDHDFWQIALQRRVPLKQSGVVLFRAHPAIATNLRPLIKAFTRANRLGSDTSASSRQTESRCCLLAENDAACFFRSPRALSCSSRFRPVTRRRRSMPAPRPHPASESPEEPRRLAGRLPGR